MLSIELWHRVCSCSPSWGMLCHAGPCWAHRAVLCCASDSSNDMQEMDAELERYHKSCAALDLGVSEGKLKQSALHKELARQRSQTQSAEQAIRSDSGSGSCHSCSLSPHGSIVASFPGASSANSCRTPVSRHAPVDTVQPSVVCLQALGSADVCRFLAQGRSVCL